MKTMGKVKSKNKAISLLLAIALVLTMFVAVAPTTVSASYVLAEGTCGDNLTWVLVDDGTLTIGGSGEMYDYERRYSETPAPWPVYKIRTVVIEDGVTTIGDYAFDGGIEIYNVTIPNSVTTIGDRAFELCNNLTSVTISNSVTTIGQAPFLNCEGLTAITVDEANPNYTSVDGVLFNKNKTELIQYPIGNTRTEYTIPSSVTTIGNGVFSGCESLTSVTIPNGVTTIGDYAFSYCENLTSVTIPNGVITIGEGAFYECVSLESATIPDGVTSIGVWAFAITALTTVTIKATVPPLVLFNEEYINEEYNFFAGFAGCENLEKIYIPVGTLEASQTAEHWSEYAELYEEVEMVTPDPEPDPDPTPNPNPNPNPTPDPDPTPTPTTPLNATLTSGSAEDIKTSSLSDEDKTKLQNAINKQLNLSVETTTTPAEADKAPIISIMGNTVVGLYLDITLDVVLDGTDSVNVKELNQPVTISITVPANLRRANRNFIILRNHNGVATAIAPKSYNATTGVLTFETDRFSLYALAYEDTTPTPTPTPTLGAYYSTHIHNYTKASYNEDGHWYNCSCGAATSEEKHSLNANGVCKCGYDKNAKTNTPVTNPSTGARNNIVFVVTLLATLAIFGTTNIVSCKKK